MFLALRLPAFKAGFILVAGSSEPRRPRQQEQFPVSCGVHVAPSGEVWVFPRISLQVDMPGKLQIKASGSNALKRHPFGLKTSLRLDWIISVCRTFKAQFLSCVACMYVCENKTYKGKWLSVV